MVKNKITQWQLYYGDKTPIRSTFRYKTIDYLATKFSQLLYYAGMNRPLPFDIVSFNWDLRR